MKKILVLIALLVIIVPISVSASSEVKNVKIEFVSNNNSIESIIKFRLKKHDQYINDIIYETDNNGVFNGDIELEDGIYELEVLEIPTNILAHTVTFNANDGAINLSFDFEEKKGSITIERKGHLSINDDEISVGGLNGVVYEIYAMEDINSFTGTKYFKDQLVKTMTTYNGFATTDLPLGKYYVNETEISEFYKLGISIESALTLDSPNYFCGISTLHKPLVIRTNVDYKLYSDEDIEIKDASSNVISTISKGTSFDNKDFYNLPYGKYRFESDNLNTIIDFNEKNEYFEYYVNDKEDLDDNKDEVDKEPDNNENNNLFDNDSNEEDSKDNKDEVDKESDSNDENNNSINDDSNEKEDSKDNEQTEDNTNNLLGSTSSIQTVVNNKLNSNMPITSSRSNKYSLLLSGIVLIVLSIIKK